MNVPEHIDHGMNNLLGLDDPEAYSCRITQMFTNDVFTGLSFRIWGKTLSQQSGFVSFNSIEYFDGPLFWQGAAIRTTSIEERDQFLTEAKLGDRKYKDRYLFEIETEGHLIRLVAGNLFYEQNEYEYKELQDSTLIKRVTYQERDTTPIILKYREFNGRTAPYASSSVDMVLEMFQQGRRFDEILHMMPWLEPEDIQACLAYARQRLK